MQLISILCVLLTIFLYVCSRKLYGRIPHLFLTPIFVVPTVMILFLSIVHISYTTYMVEGKWLTYLLEPATVAFAIPLYKHYRLLKRFALEILSSVGFGTLVALTSSYWIASSFQLNHVVVTSLVPRSVTTPIAMDIARMIGGNPTLSAVFVILTALIGITAGPILIRLFAIRSPIAIGTLLGTGAHGVGTSKAFERGEIEGAISSISMILAALFSLVCAPILLSILEK